MARFDTERQEMIALLKERKITDAKVLEAMAKVERHIFVEGMFINKAYEDIALPIGFEQTISQPFTVAFMTQSLQVKQGDKVLEIGTGSGYQSAVLATMGCRVFTIERHVGLLNKARTIFDSLKLNITAKGGDGTIGWNKFAPYNGILVTAGAPHIPDSLKNQLAEGGRLVIPVGSRDVQQLQIITRRGEEFSTQSVDGFKFVPLIGKNGWN